VAQRVRLFASEGRFARGFFFGLFKNDVIRRGRGMTALFGR